MKNQILLGLAVLTSLSAFASRSDYVEKELPVHVCLADNPQNDEEFLILDATPYMRTRSSGQDNFTLFYRDESSKNHALSTGRWEIVFETNSGFRDYGYRGRTVRGQKLILKEGKFSYMNNHVAPFVNFTPCTSFKTMDMKIIKDWVQLRRK